MNLRLVCLALVAAVLAAGEARAQMLSPTVSASLISTRVRSQGQNPFIGAGPAFLGQGALALGRLKLTASYLQGTLNPDPGFRASRPLVEGTLLLGGRARAPLAVRVGYRVDHAVLVAPTYQRRETVDGLVIGVGLNWR